jgi:hypothetical protein
VLHGILMTKNYVGETSEVAGWGIYDKGAKGAPVQGEPSSKSSLDKMCPWHKLIFNTLILA